MRGTRSSRRVNVMQRCQRGLDMPEKEPSVHHPDGLPSRVLNRIEMAGSCWNWTGATSRDGYGNVRVGGRTLLAHRAVWGWLVGEPPTSGLELDHLCRNRGCVNPDHLEPVTHRENALRGWAGKRAKRVTCPRGHLYDEKNTYQYPDGRRKCRMCSAASDRARRSRKKLERGTP